MNFIYEITRNKNNEVISYKKYKEDIDLSKELEGMDYNVPAYEKIVKNEKGEIIEKHASNCRGDYLETIYYNQITIFKYNEHGRCMGFSVFDYNNETPFDFNKKPTYFSKLEYDENNRLIKRISEDYEEKIYYNESGQLDKKTRITEGEEVVLLKNHYDDLGRKIEIERDGGTYYSFSYDDINKQMTSTFWNGSKITYDYGKDYFEHVYSEDEEEEDSIKDPEYFKLLEKSREARRRRGLE